MISLRFRPGQLLGAATCVAVALLLSGGLVGCASSGLTYSLTSPQVSMENRYVGPDLEIEFQFTQRTIVLEITNSGSDVMVNWNQATFLNPEGRASRVEPVGSMPIYTLPSRSRTRVELTLAQWFCATPRIWHRRASFQKALVYPQQLTGPQPSVRLVLPITRVNSDGIMAQEMMEFAFTVRADDGQPKPQGFPFGGVR